ncbi:Nuclear factor 7, brain [Larimichthys crocea]|uniref:Nuclear factor 7, brain n=1 Tax=Larimichthys crocea TaxID=215358 RepID=A0A0F8AE18_LARCR|nr:E3 ubiquitin-protein ligase TRIM21 [Larimichthys crocea]KAE8285677.1 Nuclear factor 7, brain [Larimichthys crocea]
MACGSSLEAWENFRCSICLDVFTKPVSIPCGHNFCLTCIKDYWDTNSTGVHCCPLCQEKFYTRPMLRVNTFIAEMAKEVKKSVEKKSSIEVTPDQTGNGNVLCDMCKGPKLTAVKSCLVCFMSYCETHLERHFTFSNLRKHKLIPPVHNLESRMCKKHDEPLELFCRVDNKFACRSCENSDHKSHEMVSMEEEAEMRKAQVGGKRNDMDEKIQARQQKIYEIQYSVEASKNNAVKALSYSTQVMTAVVDYVKRSQAELVKVILTRNKKTETETERFIKELEGEILQIKQNNAQLNQVSFNNDAFSFLENFPSLTIAPLQVKDWSDVTFNIDQFAMQDALTKFKTTVMREVRMLCDPDLNEMQQHAVDVTLDPDTAYPSLIVSEDGKQVTTGEKKRNLPNKPQRFDHVLNVLAKEGFSTGKFYYEVQVKDKTQWDLGVASKSINRKGDIRLSPKNGYWTIWLRKGNEFTANDSPAIDLHVSEIPQKVGVFVDYEGGQVSFYDVDARSCIFCFTGCNFTEEVFPLFSPSAYDGGKNSAPLVITPVKCTS